jgi:hypothetical protein
VDSLRALAAGHGRGSFSSALVAARRAASELARDADSVELVIVSPLTVDELDAASAATFAQWPGRSRVVRTTAPRAAVVDVALSSDDAGDALRPVISALNTRAAGAKTTVRAIIPVRVLREVPRAADSAAARAGTAIVVWPRVAGGDATAAPSAQGLTAGNATLVAPLGRSAVPQSAAGGRVIARWADGTPAAVESPLGLGCVRTIGVGVPAAGDVTIQPAFGAIARALFAPCENANVADAAPDSVARTFARAGAAASATALRSSDERSPLAPWLVAAALLLLIGELAVRRDAAPVSV